MNMSNIYIDQAGNMGDVLIQIINCHRRHRVLIKQFNCPLSISDAAANDG